MINVMAINRDGIVADLYFLLGNLHVAIHALNARETKDGNCEISVTISVESREHLDNVTQRIKKIQGVYSVERSVR